MLINICSAQNNDTIKDRRIIRAVGDMDFPPYEYLNKEGEPDGFNVDIFKALMKELNLDYEISLVQWTDALEALNNREADLITGMGLTKSRLAYYSFVAPNSYLYYNLITRKDNPFYNLNELSNKDIIVQEGAILSDTIKNNLNTTNIIEVLDLDLGLQLLSMGKHDAAVCPDVIANYIIKKNNLINLELSDIYAIDPIKYCIAVTKENNNLRVLLDQGMGRIKAKGIYDQIHKKWFKVDNDSKIRKYFYFILLFVIILL